MNRYDITIFFLQIAVLIFTAVFFGCLASKIKQPPVLGEMAGGLLLGPTFLGLFVPQAYFFIFQSSVHASLARDMVVKVGLLIFVFSAGIEVDWNYLKSKISTVLTISFLGILFPFFIGFALTLLLPDFWHNSGSMQSTELALFIGLSMCISAIPVIAKVLQELNMMKDQQGMLIMAAATVEDLFACFLFAVILGNHAPEGLQENNIFLSLGLLLCICIFALFMTRKFKPGNLPLFHRSKILYDRLIGIVIMAIFLSAALFEFIGLHDIFGPLLLGVTLSRYITKDSAIREVFFKFTNGFFAPLYIASIGLKTEFFSNFDPVLVLVTVVIACAGKFFGAGFGAVVCGMSLRDAAFTGAGMNARGAMEIIIASAALDVGMIDQRLFVALITMAIITSMLSMPVLRHLINTREDKQETFRI